MSRFLIYGILSSICISLTWQTYNFTYSGIDDANIYFVYMKHLAEGNGFVYNIGGERVEGFTSFLWTLLGGLIFMVFKKPEQVLFIINFIIVAAGLSYFLAKTDNWLSVKRPFSIHSIAILLFLYIIPGYFDWTVISLMETGLWSVTLMLCVINLIDYELNKAKKRKRINTHLAILIIILSIIRPEALALGPFFAIARIWQGKFFRITEGKWHYFPLLGFILGMAMITIFRMYYFGYPLPNTYYAKVSIDKKSTLIQGINYLLEYSKKWNYFFFVITIQSIIICLSGFFLIYIRKLKHSSLYALLLLGCLSIGSLLIPLYSGGDHFPLGRFFQPIMPVMLFQFFYCFYLLFQKVHFIKKIPLHILQYIPISIILVFTIINPTHTLNFYQGKKTDIYQEFKIAQDMKIRSSEMEDFFRQQPSMPSVGISAAGSFAYNYDGTTIDLMGLNNVAMAHKNRVKDGIKNHSSFELDIFLSQKPDIFLYSYSLQKDTTGHHYSRKPFYDWIFKNIMDNQSFRKQYYPVWIKRKNPSLFLHTWISDRYRTELDTNYYEVTIMDVTKADKEALLNK